MNFFIFAGSLESDEYAIKAAKNFKTPKKKKMEEVRRAPSFKKYQKLMGVDFFENEEAESYASHFDDAIEPFTTDVDRVRKVQTFFENIIQHSIKNVEARLDEISDILGSRLPYLQKALDAHSIWVTMGNLITKVQDEQERINNQLETLSTQLIFLVENQKAALAMRFTNSSNLLKNESLRLKKH